MEDNCPTTYNKDQVDSDNDTISDFQEAGGDPDMDGLPSYVDLDSDDDCIPDAAEAGDDDLATLPVDSDSDSFPDFVDRDSDNDGLMDSAEDLSCDGIHDEGGNSVV